MKKIYGVTVSVNYSDYFSWVIPYNKPHLENWIIVTDTKDKATKQLCDYHNLTCIQTDVFYENGATFNKFAGINVGLEKVKKNNWVCFLDSDIALPSITTRVLNHVKLSKTALYGCDRLNVKGANKWIDHVNNPKTITGNWLINSGDLELGSRIVHYYGQKEDNGRFGGWKPLGYFQLAHNSRFDHYPSKADGADHCDIMFANMYPREKRIFIPEFFVLHLESEDAKFGSNWKKRQTSEFMKTKTKSVEIEEKKY